ncbi:MAG: rhodanese-like domain-containing protein [Acidimicrobiia bacterium]
MPIKEAQPDAAAAAVTDGAFLLDVREPNEWAAGRAPEAVHVPMGSVVADHAEIPKDQAIYVICRSGGRSAAVTEALTTWGYDATNVLGGMKGWMALGLPMTSDDNADPEVI